MTNREHSETLILPTFSSLRATAAQPQKQAIRGPVFKKNLEKGKRLLISTRKNRCPANIHSYNVASVTIGVSGLLQLALQL
jgi:hypothetical protein